MATLNQGVRTRAPAQRGGGVTEKQQSGQRTRERVMEVALPLFAEHGYAGTSVRTITQAAGVNIATLSYHFDGKEGLYDAVVQRLHEDLLTNWPEIVPSDDVVGFYVARAWNFAQEHRVHMRMLLRHVLDRGQLPEAVMDRWTGPLTERADLLVVMLRPDMLPVQRRLLVFTLVHLVARFVIEDPRQLDKMLGYPKDKDAAIVAWLAALVKRELGLIS